MEPVCHRRTLPNAFDAAGLSRGRNRERRAACWERRLGRWRPTRQHPPAETPAARPFRAGARAPEQPGLTDVAIRKARRPWWPADATGAAPTTTAAATAPRRRAVRWSPL